MDTASTTNSTTNTQSLLSKTDHHQKQPPAQPGPSFPNSVISLLDLSSSNPNQANSSDDDDDGGDDQDEESDSTECSSSDNEENSSPIGDSKPSTYTPGAAAAHISHAVRNREPLHPINNGNGIQRCVDLRQGSWPADRPLPYPAWDTVEPQVVLFKDILDYEEFAGCIELISQQTVAAHKYNTVENYIR